MKKKRSRDDEVVVITEYDLLPRHERKKRKLKLLLKAYVSKLRDEDVGYAAERILRSRIVKDLEQILYERKLP